MHPDQANSVVLDTNVLVGAAYADHSASRTLVEACLDGRLVAVVSRPLRREYELILARALRGTGYEDRLAAWLAGTRLVEPSATPRVVPEDPDDDKLLAAAVAGGASVVVTSDRPVLALDPYLGVRILRPRAALELFLPDEGAADRPD